MKLVNFSLAQEPHATEIDALGTFWDLHNVSTFTGFTFTPLARLFVMTWRINPQYALRENPADKFQIVFREVKMLEISPSDPDLPAQEEGCLHGLSRIRPEDQMVPNPEAILVGRFELLFEFQSRRKIRIGAAEAEFIISNFEAA